jgi:hypothetical protein
MEPYRNYRHLEKLFGVTWRDLVALELTLGELLGTARQTSVICRRWADMDRFFTPIQNTLATLVGFTGKNRRHPILGSAKAYEVAYWKLYDAVACLLPTRSAGAEAAGTAREFASRIVIERWPRYVPLPTEPKVTPSREVKTAS